MACAGFLVLLVQGMNHQRLTILLGLVILLGLGTVRLNAMFAFEATKGVPVERLLKNLNRKLEADTNDLAATYQLARVHSIIYATNAMHLEVGTRSGEIQFGWPGDDSGTPNQVQPAPDPEARRRAIRHLNEAIHCYERSLALLRKSTDEKGPWWILPIHLGYAWCLDQAGRREDAIKAYRQTLEIAWQQEVIGEFNFKEWLGDRWDDVKARRNPIKGSRRKYLGPGVCFSQEVIGYLLKLLDPVKDKGELAELKDRQLELGQMGRAITPIVVPTTDRTDLVDLIDPSAGVRFDLDGSGLSRSWGWITRDAAWLVFDPKGSGEISSGLQLVGAVAFWIFWENGYQALAALDNDGDGLLERSELSGLALWRDGNGNGISEPGEVQPVSAWGITAISTRAEVNPGGVPCSPHGVRYENGDWRPTYDWLAPGAPASSIQ